MSFAAAATALGLPPPRPGVMDGSGDIPAETPVSPFPVSFCGVFCDRNVFQEIAHNVAPSVAFLSGVGFSMVNIAHAVDPALCTSTVTNCLGQLTGYTYLATVACSVGLTVRQCYNLPQEEWKHHLLPSLPCKQSAVFFNTVLAPGALIVCPIYGLYASRCCGACPQSGPEPQAIA